MDSKTKFFICAVIAASIGTYLYHRFSGPPFLVQRWAKDHAFRILHCEYRYFSRGPFNWRISGRAVGVYRVHVLDVDGRERWAWIRCVGGWNSDKTEWHWDENDT